MSPRRPLSRRNFLQSAALASAASVIPALRSPLFRNYTSGILSVAASPGRLEEFGYADVTLASDSHEEQLRQTHGLLMELSEDSLLKPFRQMVGQPAPGEDFGGWYQYAPDSKDIFELGFAPGATFGQWVSALARAYAINRSPETREKILRLNRLYAKTIGAGAYENTRFPAYNYDKLVCGLIDSHQYAGDPDALAILHETTKTALPHLPGKAIEHGQVWRVGKEKDESYTWDESYTISENLFLAYQRGAGEEYRTLGLQYLDDTYYDPLAEGRSDLEGRHAYSHVNSLCSAMQAYLTLGSEKHLRAAKNGFDMILAQSFATGGWGPNEALHAPGSEEIYKSLTSSHASFETPCGSYAHFKLTRYLLRVTRESRYGDSMERVMYNTILGSLPLEADGRAFYYSDYNFRGRKVYHEQKWPCCSGTLPQVAADYRINTYFRDGDGVYVNLYIPSTVRWTREGAEIELKQKGGYPYDPQVALEIKTPKDIEFAVNLRIPAWAEQASVLVNGQRMPAEPGTFARVRRKWKSGDRIEVELPMAPRLEAIDTRHSDTVALMVGPLVLFALSDAPPAVTRAQLLGVKKSGPQTWQVQTANGTMKLLPFTAIGDQSYTTYLRLG
ncbi:MAG TPA: beta-L-arabinofuranosidase domain-containing protein [Candidatus Sulfotelmatobacter sp.]|nr:beta-L-arabinofuranosidase domain-containing protein [Candidatus Sulfotelmatobacter sp.]